MVKRIDPFNALADAEAILTAFGVAPMKVSPEQWSKDILSVTVSREYLEDGSHYFKVYIHMDSQAFSDFLRLLKLRGAVDPATFLKREPMSTASLDRVSMPLGSALEVVAILEKDAEVIV